MTAQDETEVSDCISMGGTANLFTITEKSGIGVLTGTIDGAAYGEPTSDLPSPFGSGCMTALSCVCSLDHGSFAGHGGTFRSRGWLKAVGGESQRSVGVVRFEGEIRRK